MQYLQTIAQERVWDGIPSTTQLINGTMCAFLRLTTDYAITPDDRAFALHGTKAHSTLEKSDSDMSLIEQKLYYNDGDISGIADTLEEEPKGIYTLIDLKTSGSYKIAKASGIFTWDKPTKETYKSGPRKGLPKTVKALNMRPEMIDIPDWELQLNMYRIMYEQIPFPISKMFIFAVVRDGNTWIAQSRGIFKNTYMIPIRRLPGDYVKAYFDIKRERLLKSLERGVCDYPCDEVENWDGKKCLRYCEVAEHCPQGQFIKEQEVGKMPVEFTTKLRMRVDGYIKSGQETTNPSGTKHGENLPYFRLTPKTTDPKIKAELVSKFGQQPTQIEVELVRGAVLDVLQEKPVFESVFPQYYERTLFITPKDQNKKSRIPLCSSRGFPELGEARARTEKAAEKLQVLRHDAQGCPIVKCLMSECPYQQEPQQCFAKGVLHVRLPDVDPFKLWEFSTKSYHGIMNINNGLIRIAQQLEYYGVYSFKGYKFTLEKHEQAVMVKGKQSKQWVPDIAIDPIMTVTEIKALAEKQKRITLPDPQIEESDEDDDDPPTDITVDTETGEVTQPVNADYSAQIADLSKSLAKACPGTFQNKWKEYAEKAFDNPDDALETLKNALSDKGNIDELKAKFTEWLNDPSLI